ncbi:lipopolysaccharide biosynthesis protein [Paenibacillus sp. FSL R10-2788]|uniref:lipopolysaccharide biosynthesis protein n=1 Tax=Paenibacillus sp. FSL R10-2788 TaxID=2954694 RepID=UPI0030F635B8
MQGITECGDEKLNSRLKNFLEGFSYTLVSNLVSLAVSILIILVIPKLIGVKEYGYWQLYLFYSSYVGFLHFGWIDGIYLRFGGREYKDLDKTLFFSQFNMLFVLQLIISIIIFTGSYVLLSDANKIFIFHMIAICLLAVNLRFLLLYILQGTNRIKEYAQITMIDRILYCIIIVIFLLFGIREYKLMIVADLIGKVISLAYAMYCCRDIVFRKVHTFYISWAETIENINVGIKLMFATIASMLIIGVVRFGIERAWDVSTFGKVSLTLSVSNLLMLFVNAIGIIMFPLLRRTDEKKLPNIYKNLRSLLMIFLLGVLVVYFPFKVVLSNWLPQYADSLMYMAIIFPMCVYEGKMSLLINTYLKTLRKEKTMLKVNMITLLLSIVITVITTVILKNLDMAIVSIVVLIAFKCILSEVILSRILGISVLKDISMEVVMTFIFILTGWFLNSWIAVIIYAVAYGVYLVAKRKDISSTIKNAKLLLKNS